MPFVNFLRHTQNKLVTSNRDERENGSHRRRQKLCWAKIVNDILNTISSYLIEGDMIFIMLSSNHSRCIQESVNYNPMSIEKTLWFWMSYQCGVCVFICFCGCTRNLNGLPTYPWGRDQATRSSRFPTSEWLVGRLWFWIWVAFGNIFGFVFEGFWTMEKASKDPGIYLEMWLHPDFSPDCLHTLWRDQTYVVHEFGFAVLYRLLGWQMYFWIRQLYVFMDTQFGRVCWFDLDTRRVELCSWALRLGLGFALLHFSFAVTDGSFGGARNDLEAHLSSFYLAQNLKTETDQMENDWFSKQQLGDGWSSPRRNFSTLGSLLCHFSLCEIG